MGSPATFGFSPANLSPGSADLAASVCCVHGSRRRLLRLRPSARNSFEVIQIGYVVRRRKYTERAAISSVGASFGRIFLEVSGSVEIVQMGH